MPAGAGCAPGARADAHPDADHDSRSAVAVLGDDDGELDGLANLGLLNLPVPGGEVLDAAARAAEQVGIRLPLAMDANLVYQSMVDQNDVDLSTSSSFTPQITAPCTGSQNCPIPAPGDITDWRTAYEYRIGLNVDVENMSAQPGPSRTTGH